jgi:hypothetical protein
MQRFPLMVLVMVAGLAMAWQVVRGDFATPFVEVNNKVGNVSEAHGYVLVPDGDDGPFTVLVTTDTMQYVALAATAEKGVVPAELIGRWAIIKAEVVKAPANGQTVGMQLKILGVRSAKPVAAATQGK